MFRRAALLTFAVLALAATPAQAAITVDVTQAKPADAPAGTTNAGANTDFTLSFDLGGDESVKDIDVNLPAGLLGNPNAPAKCTAEQFTNDACPPGSKVGSQTVNITLLLAPTDVDGDVFNLTPHAGEPARLGIILRPPLMAPIKLESPVRVRPEDGGLTSELRMIPNQFKINSISLTLQAKAGADKTGKGFLTNPTSCGPAVTRLHAVGYGGGTADGQNSFTPTACDALPFAPKLSAKVGDKDNTKARSMPPLTTVIEQAPGEAATKSAKVTLLTPLAPNVGALANVCSVADFDADKCPDKSIVGQAEAVTPLLSTPLKGPVRIVENPGNLPKLVLYLNGLINLRLVGNIQLGAEGTETTFAGIPDVPLSRFKLEFTAGANGLVGTNEDICKQKPSLKGEFTAHSGKTSTVTSAATVEGCGTSSGGGNNAGGNNGGTKKKLRPTGAASLRKIGGAHPVLRAGVKRGKDGKRIRQLSVSLPAGLTFTRPLRVGVKGTSAIKLAKVAKRRLTLRTKRAKGADFLTATVKPGLVASSKLRGRARKHPKVTIVLRATDVSGKTFTLRKRVTVR
jgi:hypothetical protein